MDYCDTPGDVADVAVSGPYAYVTCGRSGLIIIDISDPENPSEIGFCDAPRLASSVAVSEPYLYVGDCWVPLEKLRVMDISDPSNPFEIGFYDAPGGVNGMAVAGSHIYAAACNAGLQIYENLLVGVEEREQSETRNEKLEIEVYPNPFSTVTTIQPPAVSIHIYDPMGRRIGTVKSNTIGRNLQPGIYFLQSEGCKSIKVIKVK